MSTIAKFNGGLKPVRSLFSNFFEGENLTLPRIFTGHEGWMPAVNICETDKMFEIEMAVPGMQKSDFKIEVENKVLTISAEKKEEKEDKNRNFTRKEYGFESFSRSFTLPDNANEEDIKAQYIDGVLKLGITKKVGSNSKAKAIVVS